MLYNIYIAEKNHSSAYMPHFIEGVIALYIAVVINFSMALPKINFVACFTVLQYILFCIHYPFVYI